MKDAILASIDAVRTRASTQETLLVLAVPVEHSGKIAPFLAMVGQQIGVAFAVPGASTPDKPAVQTGETGHWAAALYRTGWFFNQKVMAALGTDDDYRKFIQRQPSCVSGEFAEFVNGEGRSVAAHVRRAGESGTGFKALYACVPLTDAEHQKQHTQGESAFPGGAGWFDTQRAHYVTIWGHAQLRAALGVESLKQSSAAALREWAHDKGIFSTLPTSVRDE